jgi:hypothetical protein
LQRKIWFRVAACSVLIAVTLVFAMRPTGKNSAKSLKPPSTSEVITDIYKQQIQQDKVATDIRVIHLATVKSEGFAFASYNVAGSKQYASLLLSPNGYSMSTTSFGIDSSRPIQQTTIGADGFEYITGKVIGHSNIKSVVIIFSNGTSVSVRVDKGYFWYEHKAPIQTPVKVKQVIGVTDTGELIQNKNS